MAGSSTTSCRACSSHACRLLSWRAAPSRGLSADRDPFALAPRSLQRTIMQYVSNNPPEEGLHVGQIATKVTGYDQGAILYVSPFTPPLLTRVSPEG